MKVLKIYIPNSPLRNFNYIIYSEHNQEAIFIDPLDIDHTRKYLKELGLKPTYLMNTHYHPDHMHDNDKLIKEEGVKEIKLAHLEDFQLSDTERLKAHYSPGHLDPHYCFELFNDDQAFGVITGDVLFNAGIGNARQGDVNVLYKTIRDVIMKFDDQLIVYPAHDYIVNNLEFAKTVEKENDYRDKMLKNLKKEFENKQYLSVDHTIETEKKINPFMRLDKLNKDFPGLSEKEIFIELRKRRDKW